MSAVLPLADRVAIVTGSGRGIGRHVAMKLAAAGSAVVVNDLDAEVADEAVSDITGAGGRAVACPGSVTDPAFADQMVNAAIGTFGGLHILVNNAGYTWDSVVQKMTDQQ